MEIIESMHIPNFSKIGSYLDELPPLQVGGPSGSRGKEEYACCDSACRTSLTKRDLVLQVGGLRWVNSPLVKN